MTVLSVAFPLAPVGPDAAGGAEQVLSQLDRALTEAGHRSIVIACQGSQTYGALLATPDPGDMLDAVAQTRARQHHREAIETALRRWPVDLIHFHGHDFNEYLPAPGVPTLVTLHVPREWYSPDAPWAGRPATYFHCVSATQRRLWPADMPMLPEIGNGVDIERLYCHVRKRGYALALGRISPEKGFPHALDAARLAGTPLLLAGKVFGYTDHAAVGCLPPFHRSCGFRAEAASADRRAVPARAQPCAGDELSRRNGGSGLWNASRRLFLGRVGGDCGTGPHRIPGPRCEGDGRGDP
jgi:glycosyltransferase involved in cell wall biosynthesis